MIPAHLVDLLPAILISGPQLGMVVQEKLTAEGVPAPQGAVVQGRQAAAVFIVGGSAQVQQGLRVRSSVSVRAGSGFFPILGHVPLQAWTPTLD